MSNFQETKESIFFNKKIVNDYKIISEIGRGGMGVVYKAVQVKLRREVAIKTISRAQPQISTKRFEREIELAASLSHVHIAKVYDSIYDDDFMCLVMEYVDGVSLNKYLQKYDISLPEKMVLFKNICSALAYAHDNNIIHRDIKPENILVTEDGTPKIIDFGLARRMESRFDLTKSGDIFGTPRYMAPEQVMGKNSNIDYQSDIYAMGAIFYEMVTNKHMIEGDSAVKIFYKIQFEKILPPSKINKSLNKDIDKIWTMATARKKKERYQNVQSLVEDIDSFIQGRSIKRSLTQKFHYSAIIFVILIFSGFLFFYMNKEVRIDFKLGEKETQILNYIEQENYIEAINFYKQNKNINNNNLLLESITRCYSKIREKGIECLENQDVENAKTYLKIAMEAFTNDIETISYLAKAYLPVDVSYAQAFPVNEDTIKNIKQAKVYLQKCIELDPYTFEYFLLLGKIEFSLGKFEEASQYLQQGLELDKQNVESLIFLCQISYEAPHLQRSCYQYLLNIIDQFDELKEVDLYRDDFLDIEKMYREDYFKYLALHNVDNEEILKKHLGEINIYNFNSDLEETLIASRYVENFTEKLSIYIKDQKFRNKILEKSRKLKEEEYEKYYFYQLAYMYNHNNWRLAFSESEEIIFKEKLGSTIKEKNSNTIFIKYLAIHAYIQRYGFIYLLKEIENKDNSILNKILITAVMRQMKIPTKNNIFYDYEQILNLATKEKNFIDYLIASTTNIFNHYLTVDTFGRSVKNRAVYVTDEDNKILFNLANSKDERTQVSANISQMYLTNKWQNQKEFTNIENKLINKMASTNPIIRSYVHFYFWKHIEIKYSMNNKKYETAYFLALEDESEEVKKIVLSVHEHFRTYITNKIRKDGKDFVLFKLLKQYQYTNEKDEILRLYIILAITYSGGMQFSDLEKYLENLSGFEQTYAYTINMYARFSVKNEKINNDSLISVITENKKVIETEKDKNAYMTCFSLYIFSLMRHHFLDNSFGDNVLQTVFYQLYRMPDLGIANLFLPATKEKDKKAFARQYLKHKDENIYKYATSSYIALSQNAEKENFFVHAQKSNRPIEKKATALGFYQSLEKAVISGRTANLTTNFDVLFTEYPREIYEKYIDIQIGFLEKNYKTNNRKFKEQQKWIENACILAPEESKYYFERAIFSEIEEKYQEALELVEQAIENTNSKESHQYLYYFKKAELLEKLNKDREAIENLDIATSKMPDFFFSRKAAPMYFRLKEYRKAENLYSKVLLQGKMEQQILPKLGIVATYIGMNEKNIAKEMFYYINEIYKRYEYHQKKFPNKVNGITIEIFTIYTQIFPELKELINMGIFHE